MDATALGTPQQVLLLMGVIAVCANQLPSATEEMRRALRTLNRVALLGVFLVVLYVIITSVIVRMQTDISKRESPLPVRPKDRGSKPDDWDDMGAHPSKFLTVKDGKPRLFPFPLGKADASNAFSLWFESGNAAHVGRCQKRSDPAVKADEAKQKRQIELEQWKSRVKYAKEMNKHKKKWAKRLTHLKVLSAVIVISIFSQRTAGFCLILLVYSLLASELIVEPYEKPEEDNGPKVKNVVLAGQPGLAMAYLYTPDGVGSVAPTARIPVKAPSNRLMTSTNNWYAS